MAEIKQVNAGGKLESIGTVKTVVGEVKAVDASGNERILQAGDKVFANETIVTAVGGLVLIEFANGAHLDLASASQILLDTDVFNPVNATPKGEELTAEQIQEMIARGEDPTAVTEATAAGAGAGDEGGSSFVDVAFNDAKGNVGSGFETQGIPGPEGFIFTEQPPTEEETAFIVALQDVSTEVPVETPEDEAREKGNNGFGNGDQDAPGNSGPHNNAENAADEEEDSDGEGKGNNGFGNGDQDAPGNSGSNNNAENADDEEEGPNGSNANNGFGNDDQDAPGNSGSHNNAENAADEKDSSGSESKGNNGFGNGDQDAPGNSGPHNNAENAIDGNDVIGTKGNDILTGTDGNDILIGESGKDILTGGAGADEFIWQKSDLKNAEGGDTITDFNVEEGDTLNIEDLLASTKGGTLGIVEDDGNTTVTLTTSEGVVNLVTLTGVTGETLNSLLVTSVPD